MNDSVDDFGDWFSDQEVLTVIDASGVAGATKRFLVLEPTGDEDEWDGADAHWFDDATEAETFLKSIYDPAEKPQPFGFV